jgi:succinate-acetate transporter protein
VQEAFATDGSAAPATDPESWASVRDQARIVLRPVASPSTIGMFGLAAGTFVLAGLQLGWVPADQSTQVGLALMTFPFIAQLVASLVAIWARDAVVASAMAVLALTWLVTGLVLVVSPPGSTSDALGLQLLISAALMALLGLTTAMAKLAPAVVFGLAALRFAATGVYQLTASGAWKEVSGWIGLVLVVAAVYTGWAFLLEAATKKSLLPIGRRGRGAAAVHGSLLEQVRDVPTEPGVRSQL